MERLTAFKMSLALPIIVLDMDNDNIFPLAPDELLSSQALPKSAIARHRPT